MDETIFTRNFWFSFFACVAGFVLAAMPLIWSAMRIDLFPSSSPVPDASLASPKVAILFGLARFEYTTLAHLVKDTLLCGIGLGIAASINWLESRLTGGKLGRVAGVFAFTAGLGAILAMTLFIGLVEVNVSPTTIKQEYVKYLQAGYFLFFGAIIGYFGTILQVRRIVDLREKDG